MKLCDKLKYLREVEGSLRGLGRAMTQQELVRAIAAEMDRWIDKGYGNNDWTVIAKDAVS